VRSSSGADAGKRKTANFENSYCSRCQGSNYCQKLMAGLPIL
jgi:hypothetical protein